MAQKNIKVILSFLLIFAVLLTTGCYFEISLDDPRERVGEKIEEIFGKTYTITFDGNGAESGVPKPLKVRKEGGSLPDAPKRFGYHFIGWSDKRLEDNDYEEDAIWKDVKELSDITLYAVWSNYDGFHVYDVFLGNEGKSVSIRCLNCGMYYTFNKKNNKVDKNNDYDISFEEFKIFYESRNQDQPRNDEYVKKLYTLYKAGDYGPIAVLLLGQLLRDEEEDNAYKEAFQTLDTILTTFKSLSKSLKKAGKTDKAFLLSKSGYQDFTQIDTEIGLTLFEGLELGGKNAGTVFSAMMLANNILASTSEKNSLKQMNYFLGAVRHGIELIPIPLVESYYDCQLKVLQEGLDLANKISKRAKKNEAIVSLNANVLDYWRKMPSLSQLIPDPVKIDQSQGRTITRDNFPTTLTILTAMSEKDISSEDLTQEEKILLAHYLEGQLEYELKQIAGVSLEEYIGYLE